MMWRVTEAPWRKEKSVTEVFVVLFLCSEEIQDGAHALLMCVETQRQVRALRRKFAYLFSQASG